MSNGTDIDLLPLPPDTCAQMTARRFCSNMARTQRIRHNGLVCQSTGRRNPPQVYHCAGRSLIRITRNAWLALQHDFQEIMHYNLVVC